MEKELLRVIEVARMLRISERKTTDLIKAGKLLTACPNGPGKKPVFVLKSSVESYFESIKTPPESWYA